MSPLERRMTVNQLNCLTEQNIIKDPLFSKLDLISCGNLLIYMEQSL